MIETSCTGCGKRYQIDENQMTANVGRFACKSCGVEIRVDKSALSKSNAIGGPPSAYDASAAATADADLGATLPSETVEAIDDAPEPSTQGPAAAVGKKGESKPIFTQRISVKVAMAVNFCLLVVMVAGSYYLVTHQSHRLEQDLLHRAKWQSVIGAKMFGKIMEEAIDNGVFSVTDAFDADYQQIGNFDPPKFHTKYDFYTDKAILGIIDEFLLDESVVFAVPVDINGYLPTHNTRFQQPITGDVDKDRVGNRTKRVFNDPIGLKSAQNTQQGYLQIYHRDTGEVMWDVSAPIYVKGKHWGGFRIGVSLEVIAKEKQNLIQSLLVVMLGILIVSWLTTFMMVNISLAPLKRLTTVARDLATAKNMEREIPVTRKDEIGNLEEVLERLRLSMLIVKRKWKR